MQEPVPGEVNADVDHFGWFGRSLLLVSKAAAIIGGLLFVGLVVMSIVSIVGRKLFSMPVPGDVEILQMVSAAAISFFFAYCHLMQGDVKVDFFTDGASASVNHFLDAFGSLLVAAVGAVLTWRVYAGAMFALESGETSAILDLPIWWPQAVMAAGFALLALAGMYRASFELNLAIRGRRAA